MSANLRFAHLLREELRQALAISQPQIVDEPRILDAHELEVHGVGSRACAALPHQAAENGHEEAAHQDVVGDGQGGNHVLGDDGDQDGHDAERQDPEPVGFDVVLGVVSDAAVPAAVGLAGGLLIASFAAPVLGTFLFQMTPHDPWAFGWAAAVLVGTMLIAAWIPARRAASVDPVEALRAE